jgi:hypothetical protein
MQAATSPNSAAASICRAPSRTISSNSDEPPDPASSLGADASLD